MTVIDIECPRCGSTEAPRKEGLRQYRCADCGREFDVNEVTP